MSLFPEFTVSTLSLFEKVIFHGLLIKLLLHVIYLSTGGELTDHIYESNLIDMTNEYTNIQEHTLNS